MLSWKHQVMGMTPSDPLGGASATAPLAGPRTGGGPSAGELHVNDDLFAIPDDDRFLLYAPFERTALLVNASTIALLRDFRGAGRSRLASEPGLLETLARAGILLRSPAPSSARRFQTSCSGFDPTGLSLFLTTACSMRCVYCYAGGGDQKRVMPWPMARAAVDWMVAHTLKRGRKSFSASFHGGGEVTTAFSLMKRCVHYIRTQARLHQITAMLDAGLNGVMSLPAVDWVTRCLDGATVSLDGLPEVQNAQRPLADGRSSYDAVAATLRRMDERGFNYSIRATVTDRSVDRLAASVGFMSSQFRPRSIQVEPVHVSGRASQNHLVEIAAPRFVDNYRRAALEARANGVDLRYSGARLFTTTNAFCKAATGNSFALTPDGSVTSCYEVMTADDPRASLFHFGKYQATADGFELHADRISRLSSLTVEHKAHCARCFCKWHCAGDCPAKLASAGDAWDASANPRCHINRELTKDQIRQCVSGG
jgi:uncharacterized protein